MWYVDNNKLSHLDEEVKTNVIEGISEHYGNLAVSRGKKQKFLGMDIKFLDEGKLSLIMKYYTKKSIGLFREELSTVISSLAKKGLHNIDNSPTRIEK